MVETSEYTQFELCEGELQILDTEIAKQIIAQLNISLHHRQIDVTIIIVDKILTLEMSK